MKSAPSSLTATLAPLQARWRAMAPREQTLVRIASSVIAIALVWWVAVAPALHTLRSAENQQRTLEAELQAMQSLQVQAQMLQSQPVINRDDALRALQASVVQTLGTSAQLNVIGDRATLTLRSTPAEALSQWLVQARVNARALPSEARLTRAPAVATPTTSPGSPPAALSLAGAAPAAAALWSGTLVLSLPAP
jgi:general secretion pathway protein M